MMKRRTHACVAALACLAAGTASAQSTVRLFGVMDAAVSYYQTNSKDPSTQRREQGPKKVSRLATCRVGLT